MTTAILLFALIFVAGFLVSRFLRVWNKDRCQFHTVRSLLIHFLINRVVYLLGAKARRQLEQDTKNFRQVQETFLLNILKKNSETKYVRQFKFTEIRRRSDFITKYNHYKHFVGRYIRKKLFFLVIQACGYCIGSKSTGIYTWWGNNCKCTCSSSHTKN